MVGGPNNTTVMPAPAAAAGCAAVCGGNIVGEEMGYMGVGGDYIQTVEYKFVGNGQGDFGLTAVRGPSRFMWIGVVFIVLLLVALCLYFGRYLGGFQTTTMSPGRASCSLWGDPHMLTFDGKRADYYSSGEYWIVKSDSVKIQGRYMPLPITSGLAVTKEIAVGGSFLGSNVLIVTPTVAKWNGQVILNGFPSTFANDLVRIEYNGQGEYLQKGRGGKPLHAVHIHLPQGVEITVNRWLDAAEGLYVNVKIEMNAVPGMDGHCGNMNGNAEDDDRLLVRARFGGSADVPQNEMLLEGPKTPMIPVNRPNLANCATDKIEQAKTLCENNPTHMASQACMMDFCFAGGAALTEA